MRILLVDDEEDILEGMLAGIDFAALGFDWVYTASSAQEAREILEKAKPEAGELFVVGCSTSEVGGASIGTYSSPELAEVVFGGIYQATQEAGVYLAAQCCEHLNRALILEKEAAVKYGYPMVNVVPQPKAGGSFATAAYKAFEHPVAVEHIQAAAGMDQRPCPGGLRLLWE